jgi:hypothetical protein
VDEAAEHVVTVDAERRLVVAVTRSRMGTASSIPWCGRLPSRQFDDEEDVELFEGHGIHREEVVASTLWAWERRNSDQVGPPRGAGPRP